MKGWTITEYKIARSVITARELCSNTSRDLILIPPTFDATIASQAADAAIMSFQSLKGGHPTPALRPYLDRFRNLRSLSEFTDALDDLLSLAYSLKGNANIGRISDVLIALWLADCLALPRESNHLLGRFHGGRVFWGADRSDPHPEEIVQSFLRANNTANKSITSRKLLSVMFSIVGVKEIGDLTPEIVDGSLVGMKLAPSLSSTMLTIMRDKYGQDSVPFSYNDYGPFGKKSYKDNRFEWVKEKHADLEEWRNLAQIWVESQTRNVSIRRIGADQFLQYLAKNSHIPRDPSEYFTTGKDFSPAFGIDIARPPTVVAVAAFLNWILDTRFIGEDDNGHPYRLPGFRNPVSPPRISQSNLAETVREAMPTRFVRRLKEIIEENDFAWPKTAFERSVDTIRWKNPLTGSWTDVWSPVRAYAVLMKLELPERTFQVRVCNSGEADSEEYDIVNDRWRANSHALAGQSPYGKPMGLARKIKDHRTEKILPGYTLTRTRQGIWVNLQKTAAMSFPGRMNACSGFITICGHGRRPIIPSSARQSGPICAKRRF